MKYWRWRWKLFNRFRSDYNDQEWVRLRLQELTRIPMVVKGLSVDPDGRWTYPQLRAVISIIQPELNAMGLGFRQIEVTTHQDTVRWFLIHVICLKHGNHIEIDSACALCMKAYQR